MTIPGARPRLEQMAFHGIWIRIRPLASDVELHLKGSRSSSNSNSNSERVHDALQGRTS